MKRKHKSYSKPKRPFDKSRIEEEAEIKKRFGLKNKKEIWKADARINSIREKAKKLISANPEEQNALFERLKKIGLMVGSIADILALDKTDYLERRLQTIIVKKQHATTSRSARQLIVHKKVLVNGKVIDSPSYIVPTELEEEITLKQKKKVAKAKPVEKTEKVIEEKSENTEEPKEEIKEDKK
jgi:small subunit ribosomal protein S4